MNNSPLSLNSCITWNLQQERNNNLLSYSKYLGNELRSEVVPFKISIDKEQELSLDKRFGLEALQIEAARIAVKSLASLAKINELDHLGGGLDLISALMLTLAICDYDKVDYTIEHAHTSIGYYASLAALGFLDSGQVIEGFRRGIDIPGHVSWVPGGTQLNGGRLGVLIPVAVGFSLANRARNGDGVWSITHCGDAGWISGQALNGFNAADLHSAPTTFVMHRNGIQLSGATKGIMPKDPRSLIESMGIVVIEIPTLHDMDILYSAYREAYGLAQKGRPSLIFPSGYKSGAEQRTDLHTFARMYQILDEVSEFAERHKVSMDTPVWIPGSLMSFRDIEPMIECLFLCNDLPGGQGHHDGHMKNRDSDTVLSNPMLQLNENQRQALESLRLLPKRIVTTKARPASGTPNIVLPDEMLKTSELPQANKWVSPRLGSEIAYEVIAKNFPENVFIIGCDLDGSTKLSSARKFLAGSHQFEMSIQEQASALMANGLAFSRKSPQLNIFSTFAAFFEGIAREGFEMWRYQRKSKWG